MAVEKAESARDRLNRTSYIFLNIASGLLASDIDRLCQKENLTEAHFRILWVLCRESENEGRPMGEIADGLINKAADLTRLVDKLEKLGLVERFRPDEDRRRVHACVTKKGRRVFSQLISDIQDLHIKQWSGLSTTEQRQLVSLLDKVIRTNELSGAENSWILRKSST
jgi:DNA-binding MarR family transcriptional regulator